MTNTWRRPEEYELAAMQSNWRVPAIRTTGGGAPVLKPNLRSGGTDKADHSDVMRILRLRSKREGRGTRWVARVCGVDGLKDITWWNASDAALCKPGQLIRILPSGDQCADTYADFDTVAKVRSPARQHPSWDGAYEVSGVTPLWQVEPEVNLLDTVPLSWLPDAEHGGGAQWVDRFHALWAELSHPMRAWFNALFWHHPLRLHAFLAAPGSMKHHHARKHGLFIHTVDCAWRALCAAHSDEWVNVEVLVLSALLHDVGKAGEYQWNDQAKQWYLSDRGALMGHRLTGLEWMAVARGSLSVGDAPDERTAMAVYHAINACNAPDWVGLRSARTPEAFYLASVDALSGHCDLIDAHAIPNRSKGRYHPAFRGGAFVVSGAGRGMV
jgi:3'-5' exoribonuclease